MDPFAKSMAILLAVMLLVLFLVTLVTFMYACIRNKKLDKQKRHLDEANSLLIFPNDMSMDIMDASTSLMQGVKKL